MQRVLRLSVFAVAFGVALAVASFVLGGRASAADDAQPAAPPGLAELSPGPALDGLTSTALAETQPLLDAAAQTIDVLAPSAGAPAATTGPSLDGNLGDTFDGTLGGTVDRVVDGVVAAVTPQPGEQPASEPLPPIATVVAEIRDAIPFLGHLAPAPGEAVTVVPVAVPLAVPVAVPVAATTTPLAEPVAGAIDAATSTQTAATPVEPTIEHVAVAVDQAPVQPNLPTSSPQSPVSPAPAPTPTPSSGPSSAPRAGGLDPFSAALPSITATGGTAWWLVATSVFGWRSALVLSRLERPG